MIEIAAGIAAIIGVSAKELVTKVREVQSRRSKLELQKWANMEAKFATQQTMSGLLDNFYRDARKGTHLLPYAVNVGGSHLKTTMYTGDGYLSLNRPALDTLG